MGSVYDGCVGLKSTALCYKIPSHRILRFRCWIFVYHKDDVDCSITKSGRRKRFIKLDNVNSDRSRSSLWCVAYGDDE